MQLRRKARCGCGFGAKKTDSLLTLFVSKVRTTICDIHWLVDSNEWWEGTGPPTNVASWCLCLRENPDFPLGTSPLFALGHYPLSPYFLRAHSKPKDLSKNQPKTLLGSESLSGQTDWLKLYMRTMNLEVYSGSLGLLRVGKTARRPLAAKQRGLNNRTFVVKINDAYSEIKDIKAGVPQGSVLGPILYTLYGRHTNNCQQQNIRSTHKFVPTVPPHNTSALHPAWLDSQRSTCRPSNLP